MFYPMLSGYFFFSLVTYKIMIYVHFQKIWLSNFFSVFKDENKILRKIEYYNNLTFQNKVRMNGEFSFLSYFRAVNIGIKNL